MPGSAAHDVRDRVHAVHRGRDQPDLAGVSPTHRRVQAVERARHAAASASNSTSKRCSPSVHGGSRCPSPISQFDAHGHHRLAVDGSLPRESLRGDRALLDHADRRVDVAGRDRHLVLASVFSGSSVQPSSAATMSIDCMKPWPSTSIIGLFAATSGVLAEQHHLAHDHVGRVVADVGELLGAHVADVAAQAPTASAGTAR